MTLLIITIVEILVLFAGLAFFVFRLGTLLGKVATTLEAGDGLVAQVVEDGKAIRPGLEHINRTGATVAGALPLLYGFAEDIVRKASPTPERPEVAVPASGTRRSRIHDTVGYRPS